MSEHTIRNNHNYPIFVQAGGKAVEISANSSRSVSDVTAQELVLLKAAGVDIIPTPAAAVVGESSPGVFRPVPGERAFQQITNTGNFTFYPPNTVESCRMVVEIVNSATAGVVTFSGFTRVLDQSGMVTTAGERYLCLVEVLGTYSEVEVISVSKKWLSKPKQVIVVPVSDETTDLTTGTAKVTFRMPFNMALTDVRGSLATASSSGNVVVDVNVNGDSILDDLVTIEASEKSSKSAATQPSIAADDFDDDDEITIDIDSAGTGAKGLKVYLIGVLV